MEKYIQIGFVQKTHGVGGQLRIDVKDLFWEDFLETEVLFLEVAGRKTPFFVDNIKTGNLLLIKFEDVDSREEANGLTNRAAFMRESDIAQKEETDIVLEDMFSLLPGYMIVAESGEEIGNIKQVLEFPQQIMAVVDYEGKELFIPLNDVFIKGIDQEHKAILMELPEGLLDL